MTEAPRYQFVIEEVDDLAHVQGVNGDVARYALLITISYPDEEKALPGTEDDGRRMYNYLKKKGFTVTWMNDFEKDIDASLFPTKENIKNQITRFVTGKDSNDVLWFHYSGHGTQITGELSGDEADGKDEALVPAKWDKSARGLIDDDWLYNNFVLKVPKGCETYCMLDCCHSGSALDLPYVLDVESRTFVRTRDQAANQALADYNPEDGGARPPGKRPIPDGIKIVQVAGCTDEQTSKELTWSNDETGEITKRGGVLT